MLYDFKNLSPLDFERFICDLLSVEWEMPLSSYKSGRDGGIDIKGYVDTNKKIIIQCKHFANSTFSNLKTEIKKEVEKLKKLSPEKYYVVTSLALTPANKEEIFSFIKEYADNPDRNVLDCNEINQILGKHKVVEQRNFKLWLSSMNVLQAILHADVCNSSLISLDEIQQKIAIYVQNKSFEDARQILNENNCVIISGIPGIGKTTLAEILIYNYLNEFKDTDFVKVSSHISEAKKLFNHEKRQIFYYDDFLGQTQLSEKGLEKNEDAELLSFIKYVQKSKNKKFILTTREYILHQARNSYEILEKGLSENNKIKKCIVDLESYTNNNKAEILYNHLYYILKSDITDEDWSILIDNLLLKKNYRKIIEHRNYNPRIIEFMTNIHNIKDFEKYSECFIENLDNPKNIWRYAFEKHISEDARYILIIFFLYSKLVWGSINMQFIKDKFSTIRVEDNIKFKDGLQELDNSFIKINSYGIVDFQNPSIRDFLQNYIQENVCDIFKVVLSKNNSFSTLFLLWGKDNFKNNNDNWRKKLLENYPDFLKSIIYFLEEDEDKQIKCDEALLIITSLLQYIPSQQLEYKLLEDIACSFINNLYLLDTKFSSSVRDAENFKYILKNIEFIKNFEIRKKLFECILFYFKENINDFSSLESFSEIYCEHKQEFSEEVLLGIKNSAQKFLDNKTYLPEYLKEESSFHLESMIGNVKKVCRSLNLNASKICSSLHKYLNERLEAESEEYDDEDMNDVEKMGKESYEDIDYMFESLKEVI